MKQLLIIFFLLFSVNCFGGVNFGDEDSASDDNIKFTYTHTDLGTMSVWIYPIAFYNYNTMWDNNINANQWEGWIYSDGTIAIRINSTGTQLNYDLDLISGAGSWYHIVWTWDKTGDKKLYVNGVLRDTEVVSWISPGTLFYISAGGGNTSFNGYMSEFAEWNVILTADEILKLYSKVKRMPLQIQPSSLKIYLPLDDFSDGTNLDTSTDGYKDISGNGNHGTGTDGDTDAFNIAETILTYP